MKFYCPQERTMFKTRAIARSTIVQRGGQMSFVEAKKSSLVVYHNVHFPFSTKHFLKKKLYFKMFIKNQIRSSGFFTEMKHSCTC